MNVSVLQQRLTNGLHSPGRPNVLLSTVCPGHIRTPLFAGLGDFSALNAFLFPLLEPHEVAKSIVDRVEAEHGGELHLPTLGNLSWLWRGLPSWARHGVKWVGMLRGLAACFWLKRCAVLRGRCPDERLSRPAEDLVLTGSSKCTPCSQWLVNCMLISCDIPTNHTSAGLKMPRRRESS